MCGLARTSNRSQGHGFRALTQVQGIQIALRITVVSCSTHQSQFKQQLAPWSLTSEVSTSDPLHGLEFLGPKTTQPPEGKTQRKVAPQEKSGAERSRVLVATSTV